MWKCQSLSRVWLFVTPMDCSPPGFSIHGILQTRILEWVAISFSRGSSWSKNQAQASCITGRFLTFWATKNTQSRNRRCFHFVLLLQQITTNFWLKQCTFIVLVSWRDPQSGFLKVLWVILRHADNGGPLYEIFKFKCFNEWIKFFLFLLLLCFVASGILVPWLGIKPGPQQWKHQVLITGLPGNLPVWDYIVFKKEVTVYPLGQQQNKPRSSWLNLVFSHFPEIS